MIIAIYASDELKFQGNKEKLTALGYSEDKIIFADSSRYTRLDVIKKYPQQWLFFMDHDCMLTQVQAQNLNFQLGKLKNNHQNQVVAGVYTDSEQSTIIQKAHNWIANTWLSHSYETYSEFPLVLGGVFLVHFNRVQFEKDLGVGVWGAEDKYLALVLKKAGFKFVYNPEIKIQHITTASFKHFLKRAYLHGVNDVKYFNQSQQGSNFLYWLRKIDYLNVRLVVLIALHFFVQRGAKIFQTIRQSSKS